MYVCMYIYIYIYMCACVCVCVCVRVGGRACTRVSALLHPPFPSNNSCWRSCAFGLAASGPLQTTNRSVAAPTTPPRINSHTHTIE